MIDININEYAAIVFHVVENCDDWHKLYTIAKGPKSLNKQTPDSKKALVSKWKNSPEIKRATDEIKKEIETKKDDFKKMIISGLETETTNSQKESIKNESVNFLDRDEFLKFLNDRANEIQDDKLRNDILKMLSDNLRYKDSETAENNEIQRFYTPKICENCQIYNKCKDCKLEQCPKML